MDKAKPHLATGSLPNSQASRTLPKGKEPQETVSNQEAPKEKRVSPWIKAFVLFHCVAIFIWATPNPPQTYNNGTPWQLRTDGVSNFAQSLNDGYRVFNRFVLKDSPVKFYNLSTGFWQYWDMFAPNPADTDFFGDAVITYQDGSKSFYNYPRMYKLDFLSRYTKERYRKFFERANSDDYRYLWTQFAQYIALLNYKNHHNPPVKVELTRHWRPVLPPSEPQPKEYKSYQYFTFTVDQDKLAWDSKSMFVEPYVPQINISSETLGGLP